MDRTQHRTSPIRFGVFEARADDLRKHGVKVKLQDQPLKILLILLERAGELVTREELQSQLWPADTFVDFERGLNRAVNKLRQVLGDDSENPRFIETVPRRGYRFIAPVTTPEPVLQPETPPPAAAEPVKPVVKRWTSASWALAGVLLLSLGLLFGLRHRFEVQPRIEAIAVLPLQDLSDPAQVHFADGMTDGLLTEIARIGSLRVISRTSVMQYKGTSKNLRTIAKELGVDAILEGTITHSGNRVRITAQLIRAADDRHIWAEKYDREVGDSLKLQGEVAETIARQVEVKLAPQEHAALRRERRVSQQAYEAYLEGSFFGSKVTEDNLNKSVASLQKAIEIDPGYAQGYASLSHSYYVIGMLGFRPAKDAYPLARRTAERALELDSTIAEAHNTLAEVERGYEWNWAAAEVEFQRALALNPSYALAHSGYAGVLSNMGRHEEAIAQAERARQLDPVSVSSNTALGRILYRARRFDQSIQACQKASDLDPNDPSPLWWMALSHEQKSDLPKAVAALEKAAILSGRGTLALALLANANAQAGDTGKAKSILDELTKLGREKYVSPVDFAIIHTGLGDRDSAFRWLEEAYQNRTMRIQQLPEAVFDTLRSDPRFSGLLRRLNLAP